MKKRMLSLLCVLALCLGLLPATALAAEDAPAVLYVGNCQITNTSGTTYLKAGSTEGSLTAGSENDWTVKYEPSTATLTLNGATIQGGTSTGSVPYGAGIYAQCNSGESVSLTIELIGENTITGYYGIYVNAEISADSYGTDASLTITGESNGSLKVSGSYHGIYVKSGTGGASLNINDASVVASSSYFDYAGVYVQSSAHATSSPQLSLKVNGGSLTASGTGSSDGIWFYVGAFEATGATTSLTVSENAIVDARNGGISALKISETLPTPTPTGDNRSGIVFDGTEGTVYGEVELQNVLEIKSGETLTVPDGSKLDCNEKLTNNGTINVEDGGTVSGNLSGGTTITTPSISQQPQSTTVTEVNPATFAVTASDVQSYQWQQSTDIDQSWSDIDGATNDTYSIEATTTSMSGYQYRCVVTSASGVSVISSAATLTVTKKTEPTTYTISAYASPAEGGSVTVNDSGTWPPTANAMSPPATPTWPPFTAGRKMTAVSTTATYTFNANGDRTLTAKFEKKVTGVTLDKTTLELFTGGTGTLTATVEPDDATNKNVTWQSDSADVATVQNGTVTAVGAGETTIRVTTEDGGKTATCTVTVSRYSSGGGSSSSSTSLSDRAIDDIQDARPGDTVEIALRPGRTTLEREVFEELAGQDITLEIDAGDGVLWTVNGLDIPEDTRLHDLDLDVDLGDSGIPATVLNAVTGEIGTVQLSLAHDGRFGFTMTLSAPLGRDNADYWANLYWYNERTEELEFQQAARIARDGTAEFALDHASDYAIVIDDRSHEPVDLPFTDVPEGYWAYDAIQYVYGEGLMAGTSGSAFSPEGTTTRGQIVTILWRLSGSPVVNYRMDFSDVDPAAYYGEAIRWATSEGIVGGYGGGVFGPNDPITREQLATMLWRYAQTEGYDVSVGEDTNILSYTDAFDVAEYAISAMQWACGAGVINGTGDGSTLTPQGQATRAQAAVMLQRFCEKYVIW